MTLQCTSCKTKLKIPEHLYGKQGKCPKCGEILNVPLEDIEILEVDKVSTAPQTSSQIENFNVLSDNNICTFCGTIILDDNPVCPSCGNNSSSMQLSSREQTTHVDSNSSYEAHINTGNFDNSVSAVNSLSQHTKENSHKERYSSTYVWLLPLILLCGCILLYGVLYSKLDNNYDMAFMIGYKSIPTIVIWGLYNLAFNKYYTIKRNSLVTFLTILICMVLQGEIANQKLLSQKNEFKKEIGTEIKNLYENPDYQVKENNSRPNTTHDALPVLSSFVKQIMRDLSKESDAYSNELHQIGWNTLFDYNRIKNDKDLSHSFNIIEKGRIAHSKFKEKAIEAFDRIETDALKLNIDENTKQDFIKGYRESRDGQKENYIKMIDSDRELIEIANNMFLFLQETRGKWNISNDVIVFDSASDLNKYNEIIEGMQSIVKAQQKYKETLYKRMQDRLNNL